MRLKNPLVAASGTAGLVHDAPEMLRLDAFAACVTKTITPRPRPGNPAPRVAETPCGVVNSVGLENPGVEAFVAEHLGRLSAPRRTWISAGGETAAEVIEVAERLSERRDAFAAVELNLSCPNTGRRVDAGDAEEVAEAVRGARAALGDKPLLVKLAPGDRILKAAAAAMEAGADALTIANTYPALPIDWATLKPVLGAVHGGLSGPAVRPLTMRLVAEVWRALGCDIVASGGVTGGVDVLAYVACGACCVQIGAGNLVEPGCAERILKEIAAEMHRHGVQRISELRGFAFE